MLITSKKIKKLVAIYLLLGSFLSLIWLIMQLGLLGYLTHLFPALFTTCMLIFAICSCVSFLRNPESKLRENLLGICISIHAIQFSIFGLHFANYFGPYFGVGMSFESALKFFFEIHVLAYKISNGYVRNDNEIYLVINLVPICILLLINYLEHKEKEKYLKPNHSKSDREIFDTNLDE